MRRDLLLLGEMIEAADRAAQLAGGVTAEELAADRQRSEALLWNFTVLGEATRAAVRRAQGGVPGHPMAATRPAAQPDRARLLVH
jgi:uncharacterized protein with HEPN domain